MPGSDHTIQNPTKKCYNYGFSLFYRLQALERYRTHNDFQRKTFYIYHVGMALENQCSIELTRFWILILIWKRGTVFGRTRKLKHFSRGKWERIFMKRTSNFPVFRYLTQCQSFLLTRPLYIFSIPLLRYRLPHTKRQQKSSTVSK